jgi:integrase
VATIRQRRRGVWEVRVFTGRRDDGRPTQVSRTVHGGKREALRVAATLESRPPARAAGHTVADVLHAWCESNEAVWAESSRRDYASRIRSIAQDPIAKVAIARLGVDDVERWHARMRKAGVGEDAIRGRHATLRAALTQAVRWGWLGTNPAASARLRQPSRAPRQAMTPEEVRAVIEAAGAIDELAGMALRLASLGGLRRAELAALRWDEIEGDRLTVDSSVAIIRRPGEPPTVVDAPTKTANRRTIRLDAETAARLAALRDRRRLGQPYLFSIDDEPANPDRIGWWWRRAREMAGIDPKWRLHDLRHWSATMAISAGADVRTVAGRLGHANAAMTLRVYAHALEAGDQVVADTLGRVLDDKP